MARKKKARKKKSAPKKRRTLKKKIVRGKKRAAPRKRKRRARLVRGRATAIDLALPTAKGLGSAAGGQSGDVQGLSETEGADSESVAELAEEGQDFEAEVVSGVERARDADQGEVRTHEVPDDDVPQEYRDRE